MAKTAVANASAAHESLLTKATLRCGCAGFA